MSALSSPSRFKRSVPALVLLLLAPMVAEVLPGATRFSSIFVLPIEICVWGGGAVLIREAVRRGQLGWRNMMLLALALAVAEECLIQQTSLAPMVLQLKGQVYARAHGVNYVYMLWALVYEMVFVVFLPIHLTELIFPQRRQDRWVSRGGLVALAVFFIIGAFLAWFSWTRIARAKVFHVPVFTPPLEAVIAASVAIVALVVLALGFTRNRLARPVKPSSPPSPWTLGIAGAIWATLWYGLVVLGFGAAPAFPPIVAVASGLLLVAGIRLLLPRWAASPQWQRRHLFGVVAGTVLGSMAIGFFGFIGATPADLYFKIVVDAIAALLLLALGRSIAKVDLPQAHG